MPRLPRPSRTASCESLDLCAPDKLTLTPNTLATPLSVLAEEKAQGHISKRALSLLAKSLGGPVFWLIVIGLMIVNQAASLAQVAVLGAWAREYDVKPREDVVVAYWLGLYGGIVFLATGTFAVGFWVWTIGSVRSGVSIHEQLLDSVFAATMRWLDSTPQGEFLRSEPRKLDVG
jgi:ABC-type multidrug transport system fused ATPase/permease subunit